MATMPTLVELLAESNLKLWVSLPVNHAPDAREVRWRAVCYQRVSGYIAVRGSASERLLGKGRRLPLDLS